MDRQIKKGLNVKILSEILEYWQLGNEDSQCQKNQKVPVGGSASSETDSKNLILLVVS